MVVGRSAGVGWWSDTIRTVGRDQPIDLSDSNRKRHRASTMVRLIKEKMEEKLQ